VPGFYRHLIAQAGIIVQLAAGSIKYDIAPKNKNAVEIDSLQAYFQFSCKLYKNCYTG